MRDVKDITSKFAEVEKRIGSVMTENESLRKRVEELEKELADARRASREFDNFHGKTLHIREKIERILESLEAAGGK